MSLSSRAMSTATVALGLLTLAWGSRAGTQQDQPSSPQPRPGLTAQQTKRAVELAQGAMRELRKKTEGASNPDVDQREYIVSVELLAPKETTKSPEGQPSQPKATTKPPATRAVVTSYRYLDDITVFSTLDLDTG